MQAEPREREQLVSSDARSQFATPAASNRTPAIYSIILNPSQAGPPCGAWTLGVGYVAGGLGAGRGLWGASPLFLKLPLRLIAANSGLGLGDYSATYSQCSNLVPGSGVVIS